MVAVTVAGETCVELAARAPGRHGESLLGHVERALGLAGFGLGDLDLLAVGLGPGSFTGVRIGVATAKGFALARRTPLVGVRTTRVLARGAYGTLRAAIVDAHKGEVFVAVYEAGDDGRLTTRLEEMHGTPEAMGRRVREAIGPGASPLLVGNGLAVHGARLTGALGLPHACAPRALEIPRGSLLALEAEERFAASGPDDPATLEPLYVRASDAVLPASRADASHTER